MCVCVCVCVSLIDCVKGKCHSSQIANVVAIQQFLLGLFSRGEFLIKERLARRGRG